MSRGRDFSIAIVLISVAMIGCTSTPSPPSAEITFIEGVHAHGLSHNGEWVVGFYQTEAGSLEPFRWSAESGVLGLGTIEPTIADPSENTYNCTSHAVAVSDDGMVVVGFQQCRRMRVVAWYPGSGYEREGQYIDEAFVWIEGSGIWTLSHPEGLTGDYCHPDRRAYDVTPDGRYIVGQFGDCYLFVGGGELEKTNTRTFIYRISNPHSVPESGPTWTGWDLDTTPYRGIINSGGRSILDHPLAIVGWMKHRFNEPPYSGTDDPFHSPFRLPYRQLENEDDDSTGTSFLPREPLGLPPGAVGDSTANDISVDRSTIVGWSSFSTGKLNSDPAAFPFKWTSENGWEILDIPCEGPDYRWGKAFSVSADGKVIVGEATNMQCTHSIAVIWTPLFGVEPLADVLHDRFNNYGRWTFETAVGVSDEGRVIVANGENFERVSGTFIIRLSRPANYGYVPQNQ